MLRSLLAASAILCVAGAAGAQALESGDAGQQTQRAQNLATGTGTAIASIAGTIASGTDVDLYRIYIASPAQFSATTVNAVTGGGSGFAFDTKLFLFSGAGAAIESNDDSSGDDFRAVLTAANPFSPTTAGFYLLGISNASQEASNGPPPNQDLFTQESDTTSIRGPAAGVNPATLGGWFTVNDFNDTGAYRIDLTGVTTGPAAAAVPEPAAWAMTIAGFGLAGVGLRARRRRLVPG